LGKNKLLWCYKKRRESTVFKKLLPMILVFCLVFAPVTASASGFGSRGFSSRSSYSSSSRGYSGSTNRGFSGLFGSRSNSRTYTSPRTGYGSAASHLSSFGLGMLAGSLFHPFGGYYGYGASYGYYPFSGFHFILDLIILFILFRVIRGWFRRR
jgi:hypothetical protein